MGAHTNLGFHHVDTPMTRAFEVNCIQTVLKGKSKDATKTLFTADEVYIAVREKNGSIAVDTDGGDRRRFTAEEFYKLFEEAK